MFYTIFIIPATCLQYITGKITLTIQIIKKQNILTQYKHLINFPFNSRASQLHNRGLYDTLEHAYAEMQHQEHEEHHDESE